MRNYKGVYRYIWFVSSYAICISGDIRDKNCDCV